LGWATYTSIQSHAGIPPLPAPLDEPLMGSKPSLVGLKDIRPIARRLSPMGSEKLPILPLFTP
jgi:hypothetical protein